MTTTLTAAQIDTAARELADMDQPGTGPAFVDSTEALERINEAAGALWDLLVAEGAETALMSVQMQVDVAAPTWPSDMLRLVSLHVRERGGTDWVPLERADFEDVTDFDTPDAGRPVYYIAADLFTAGATVPLLPTPSATTYDFRMYYVPDSPTVDDSADTIELPGRWHTWIKYEVAIHMLAKEESDPSLLLAKQQRLEQAILKATARVDMHRPRKLRRARRRGGRHPRDGGWWGMP